MLTRAARRRHALRYFQHAAEQLQLPWLCPALARSYYTQQRHNAITSRPLLTRPKSVNGAPSHSRHLASPAAVPEDFDRSEDYLQFSYSRSDSVIARRSDRDLSTLPPYNLSEILMIDHTTALPAERIDTNRVAGIDIRGNVNEVEATLDACLQVHRWDRAFALLSQLGLLYENHLSKLRQAYNRVLASMADDLLRNRNRQNEDRINNWVEVEMRKAGLEPDAQTFALKIKVALESLMGSKRDRTVRRYWEMARRHGLDNEVASLRGILDERDLGKLSQICPLKVDRLKAEEVNYFGDFPEQVEEDSMSKDDIRVLETEQKGMGLATLKQSLSLFSEVLPAEGKHQDAEMDAASWEKHAVERQRKLERDAIDAAVNRWQAEHEKMAKMGISGNFAHGKVGALLWQWHEILTEKIVKELELVREAESKSKRTPQDKLRVEYGPFLEQLSPTRTAAVTAIAMMQLMNKAGVSKPVKLVRLVTELGQIIETEHDSERLRKKNALRRKAQAAGQVEGEGHPSDTVVSLTDAVEYPLRRGSHHSSQVYMKKMNWSHGIHAKLGAILCELLFDTAKITITKEDKASGKKMSIAQPIFVRQNIYQNGRRVGVVSLHESFVDIMVAQPAGDMIAKQLPMVCPPRPWKSFYEGGFLESDQPFLRIKFAETAQRDYGEAAAARGDLDQLFAGVDVLGRTGWKVNRNVFQVMLEAWNSGEAIANLPPLAKEYPRIERPGDNATAKERYDWYAKMRAIDNERGGIHSNRCFQNFQMEIAKAYLNETFYLPHNIDFRGRAYPIPPYLNQMGADNARGLLTFAKGRELGEDGLRWLKIHLSNVYGYDKASLSDRAQFPMDHIDDIHDSVQNPLHGRRWWLTAEDPWQCLAACFELANALDRPDPSTFVSHLPIHQDGSCNGLQHYAALGGDIAGAKQVNLEPGDKPADVYTGVCELVKSEIKQDAANGDPLAHMLDGRVTRKVVKQTVMTNVYGVTFLGAIRQVRKQVDALIPEMGAAQLSGKAATYIARKIFKSLGAMFTGAHDIQYWLGDCANRISASISAAQLDKIYDQEFGHNVKAVTKLGRRKQSKNKDVLDATAFRSSVIWTTPLKLPVVQPYRINKGQKIQTNLQNISLAEPSVADAVNKRKQLQAFPPNFVHSLDATHMVLSALKADELGLTFSAVHDSFWTHAADVNTLNRLLRDAFIRMHSEDIVGRLAAEFKLRYQGHLYLAQVNRHNPLGRAITEYRKGLAMEGKIKAGNGPQAVKERRYAELVREIRKKKLMESDDPNDREEGEKMVTAATLFAQYNGEKYLSTRDSLGETAIGAVPETASSETIEAALNAEHVADDVDVAGALDPLVESVANEGDLGEADVHTDADADADVDDVAPPSASSSPSSAPEPHVTYVRDALGQKTRKQKKTSRTQNNQIWLWLPLTFRPVPKKGEFDVTRLRDSQYFFS